MTEAHQNQTIWVLGVESGPAALLASDNIVRFTPYFELFSAGYFIFQNLAPLPKAHQISNTQGLKARF